MSNIENTVAQIENELHTYTSVEALVLVGSYARDIIYSANEHSDLEIYLVINDDHLGVIEEKLPALVRKLGNVMFSFQHQIGFVTVFDNLFRLEISLAPKSKLESIFNRPKAQTVKIIFDKTQGVLQGILDERPEDIDYAHVFTDIMTNFWYWQIIGVQYFKKGELYNTRAILNIHASNLIKLFELLNDPQILLLETNKRVEQFLTNEQIEHLKKLTVNYTDESIKSALISTMDIYHNIAQEVKTKYGYEYDETIEEKVRGKLIAQLQ